MNYKRLTPRDIINITNINDSENLTTLLQYAIRLHKLEDMLENGTLINTEKYYIAEGSLKNKYPFLICLPVVNTSIWYYCNSYEEAEAKLKELNGEG